MIPRYGKTRPTGFAYEVKADQHDFIVDANGRAEWFTTLIHFELHALSFANAYKEALRIIKDMDLRYSTGGEALVEITSIVCLGRVMKGS